MASPGSSGTPSQEGQISSSGSRHSSMDRNGTTEPTSLTIGVLQKVTDNFSEERALGQGAYGKVFKGVHDTGEEIAVKLLHNNMQAIDDGKFKQEFDNLMMLNHQNIVRLVGYCYETQRQHMEFEGKIVFGEMTYKALCFEYMHNGSLQKHIHDESHGLEWDIRYKIIKGICEGLNYLHEGCEEPIYHLDLKPDNILLDEDMTPKLADFGLSKLFGEEQTKVTQCPLGTIGYMPPEYLFQNIVSKKVDIFSLGVVMIKIIAGPKGHTRSSEKPYEEFLDQVQENWRNRLQASNSQPLEAYCQQVNMCTKIALSCMETDRHKRPTIVHIMQKLNGTGTLSGEQAVSSGSKSKGCWMRGDLVKVQAFTRSEAIPGGQSCEEFPVLVRVTGAPWHGEGEMPRVGVDVVALVDMTTTRQSELDVVKQALSMAVVERLGPNDRLSIVSFEDNVPRTILKLTYMSDQGRDAARIMVSELAGNEGNDIIAGLREGAKILRAREVEGGYSPIGCIMFLSDSHDMSFYDNHHKKFTTEFPAYTFGLGDEHNPALMKFIADMTGGTYSFVSYYDIDEMKNAFQLFLRGITRVVATSLKIKLRVHDGVAISSIFSSGHDTSVSYDKQSGEINIRDIYAGERKNSIVYLTVEGGDSEKLLTVGGRYKSFVTRRKLAGMDVFVQRPPRSACTPGELAIHREVAAELVRIRLRNDVLHMNTDRPDEIVQTWNRIKSSEEGRGAPEETLLELGNEVEAIRTSLRYTNRYAYRLSWLTCHGRQRATIKGAHDISGAFTIPE